MKLLNYQLLPKPKTLPSEKTNRIPVKKNICLVHSAKMADV